MYLHSVLSKERMSARDTSFDKTDSPSKHLIEPEGCCERSDSASSSESNIPPSDSFCDSTEISTHHTQLQCKVKGAYSIIFPIGDSFEGLGAAPGGGWLVSTEHQEGTAGMK